MPDEREPPACYDLAYAYRFALDSLGSATDAIEHPLGFTMLPPRFDGAGGYIRIHIWRRDEAARELPHSHSGELRSTILLGALVNHDWLVVAASRSQVPVVAVDKTDGGRDYRSVGFARTARVGSTVYRVGESYTVAAGAFHSTECESDICVTFLERSPPVGVALVLTTPEAAAASDRVPVTVSRPEIAAVVAALRAQAQRLGIYPDISSSDGPLSPLLDPAKLR